MRTYAASLATMPIAIQALAGSEASCHHTIARYAAMQGARTPSAYRPINHVALTPSSHAAIVHRVKQAKRAHAPSYLGKG